MPAPCSLAPELCARLPRDMLKASLIVAETQAVAVEIPLPRTHLTSGGERPDMKLVAWMDLMKDAGGVPDHGR